MNRRNFLRVATGCAVANPGKPTAHLTVSDTGKIICDNGIPFVFIHSDTFTPDEWSVLLALNPRRLNVQIHQRQSG